jgi:hypothetical protein
MRTHAAVTEVEAGDVAAAEAGLTPTAAEWADGTGVAGLMLAQA